MINLTSRKVIAERFGYLVAKFGVSKPFVYFHTGILRKVVGKSARGKLGTGSRV